MVYCFINTDEKEKIKIYCLTNDVFQFCLISDFCFWLSIGWLALGNHRSSKSS
jgi:hypothetical protein